MEFRNSSWAVDRVFAELERRRTTLSAFTFVFTGATLGAGARFFRDKIGTEAIASACKAIYRALTNNGPWGFSALCKISGIDFDRLSPDVKRRINSLPAMIYHGVKTEAAVLMRMNNVPRSIAEPVGKEFERRTGIPAGNQTVGVARDFLRALSYSDCGQLAPRGAAMSVRDYREVWARLSGEIADR